MIERQKIDFNDQDFSYVKKNYIKNTKINSEKIVIGFQIY